jgi:hypothetical protein
MTNVQVTWTVSQTAAQPGIVDAASVAFRGDGIFNGSGDLKNIAAVAVTFGGTLSADFNSIKPSPIIIDVNLAGGSDYNALLSTHTTYLQVYSTFADYNEVKRDPTKGATGGTTFSNIDGGAPAGAPTTTIDGGTVGSPYDAGYDGGTP